MDHYLQIILCLFDKIGKQSVSKEIIQTIEVFITYYSIKQLDIKIVTILNIFTNI